MIKRRPLHRTELQQRWMDMENKKYPESKRQMVARKKKRSVSTSQYSLCNTMQQPSDDLSTYTIWLHGAAGIGKTSLSSMFPSSHLFCAGGQAKALKAHYVVLQSWDQFQQLIDQFKESKFLTATIDLLEVMYDMCFEHVLQDLGIDYPGKTKQGKDDYGKSWFFIRKEFATTINKLMALESNQGLVMVSNSIHGERALEEGSTVEDVHPNLSARPLNMIAGAVDIIGYYTLNSKSERELLIRPKPGVMAKCRIDHRFKYADGMPIESIPMGNNKKEAYDNFVLAFNNKLIKPQRKDVVRKRRVKR